MGHQAISRWTCDNCKTEADLEMTLIGLNRGTSQYETAAAVGWSIYDGMTICLNCADAMTAALVALRKETPDAQSS